MKIQDNNHKAFLFSVFSLFMLGLLQAAFIPFLIMIVWNEAIAPTISVVTAVTFWQAFGIGIFIEIVRGKWDLFAIKSKDLKSQQNVAKDA